MTDTFTRTEIELNVICWEILAIYFQCNTKTALKRLFEQKPLLNTIVMATAGSEIPCFNQQVVFLIPTDKLPIHDIGFNSNWTAFFIISNSRIQFVPPNVLKLIH